MSAGQLNDTTGNPLTKFLSGETIAQGKKRLFPEGGILENSDGLALTDDDLVTVDGAPYVFKRPEDQKPAQMENIMEFVQNEMNDRTKKQGHVEGFYRLGRVYSRLLSCQA